MNRWFIKSAGIAAPGLSGWAASREVLRGAAPFVSAVESAYTPSLLPPNERRRASATVRQAFRAAEDALGGRAAGDLASVFASSDGDLSVLHRICTSLSATPRVISPTDFHNSVHNAASGYWSIAVQSKAPTTTLSAHDESFCAGLLEALALARTREGDVLLVAYDAMAPQPLLASRSLEVSASIALVIGHERQSGENPLARIEVELAGGDETGCANAALEAMRGANPALRALPLFELLAAGRAGAATLRGTGELRVTVRCVPWT
jgi:hypothetical protein